MILEKQKENLELNDGVSQESFLTEIDFDSADFLKQMLSKFYADAIGSLIRETASNALDSHREVGIDEPIIVSLNKLSNGNLEFSVEDFGVGVDKDTINNILRKYGKSTKRNSSNQLGAFGLGWKSPLAYTPSFHFIGRKNGVEISCIMYEGESDIKIDIIHEKPTTERNGCKVIVPVKNSDRWEFEKKIVAQLAYFENVYFNVLGVSNDFTIYRSENFQVSQMCPDSYMHICLDNVYYPIDFDKLGIKRLSVPLGLKFSLTDGLFPTPNRESLKYTEEAKQIIKDKIVQVANDLVDMYNENTLNSENVFTLLDHYSYSQRYVSINSEIKLEISDLIKGWATEIIVEPELSGLTTLSTEFLLKTLKFKLIKEYEIEYELSGGRLSQVKNWKEMEINHFKTSSIDRYIYSDRLGGVKKEYVRYLHGQTTKRTFFVKKKSFFILKPTDIVNTDCNLYHILNLKTVPRTQWRAAINDFFYVRDLIVKDKFIDLDALEIPQNYLDDRKAKMAKRVMNKTTKKVGEVVAKLAMDTQRYTDSFCKFESFNLSLDDLHKKPMVCIYGKDEEKHRIASLYSLLKGENKTKYKLITFSNREYKKVEDLKIHNLISIDAFMKGDTSLFSKIATAHLIKKIVSNNTFVFDTAGLRILDYVNTDLKNKIVHLDEYVSSHASKGDVDLIKVILEIAEANDLFDNEVYSEYLEIKQILEKLYFLNTYIKSIRHTYYYIREDSDEVRALVDLFKYHKVKVNLQWYTAPKVEIDLLTELENA